MKISKIPRGLFKVSDKGIHILSWDVADLLGVTHLKIMYICRHLVAKDISLNHNNHIVETTHYQDDGIMKGFLLSNEGLLKVLKYNNDFVCSSKILTIVFEIIDKFEEIEGNIKEFKESGGYDKMLEEVKRLESENDDEEEEDDDDDEMGFDLDLDGLYLNAYSLARVLQHELKEAGYPGNPIGLNKFLFDAGFQTYTEVGYIPKTPTNNARCVHYFLDGEIYYEWEWKADFVLNMLNVSLGRD